MPDENDKDKKADETTQVADQASPKEIPIDDPSLNRHIIAHDRICGADGSK